MRALSPGSRVTELLAVDHHYKRNSVAARLRNAKLSCVNSGDRLSTALADETDCGDGVLSFRDKIVKM